MHDLNHLCDVQKPDFVFADERGTICQLVHEGYQQVNVVYTKKGSKRGGFHYHKENEELFYIVCGKIKVCLRLNAQTEEYVFEKGDMFRIHKYVRHNFSFLEDTILVGFYDRSVERPDGTKDIYTDE